MTTAKGSLEYKARMAVSKEISSGRMVRASTLECVKCKEKAAKEYHHHLGYEEEHWLDVIPLCRKCHRGEDGTDWAALRDMVERGDFSGVIPAIETQKFSDGWQEEGNIVEIKLTVAQYRALQRAAKREIRTPNDQATWVVIQWLREHEGIERSEAELVPDAAESEVA